MRRATSQYGFYKNMIVVYLKSDSGQALSQHDYCRSRTQHRGKERISMIFCSSYLKFILNALIAPTIKFFSLKARTYSWVPLGSPYLKFILNALMAPTIKFFSLMARTYSWVPLGPPLFEIHI